MTVSNRKSKQLKTAVIIVRIDPLAKKDCQELAKEMGLTLSELIILRLQNLPIDNKYDKDLKTQLLLLKREMNAIGVNINQVTHAIHIERLLQSGAGKELAAFNDLLRVYNERISEMNNSFITLLNF